MPVVPLAPFAQSATLAMLVTFASPPAPVELILHHGVIHTMDRSHPRAEAVALGAGRILRVGEASEVLALKGPATTVIDLKGATVVPGLVDSHAHVAGLGFSLSRLSLTGTRSAAEIASLVAKRAAGARPGEVIRGRGWDQNDWPETSFPVAAPLDEAAPRHPVVLERVDGHAIWVNSAAMSQAGITSATPDPPGGRIVRDASGRPTGVFVDAAESLVESKLPSPSRDELREALRRGMTRCLQVGLVGVHDAGVSAEVMGIYRELLVEGDFPFRVYAMLADEPATWSDPMPPAQAASRDGRFAARAVKLYVDGALGSRGAALLAPYEDDPGQSGLLQMQPGDLRGKVARAAAAGYQPCVHAIGDRGNRMTLDAFASVLAGLPEARRREARFRVEHAQVVSGPDLPRFAQLGVIASMQPTHATSDLPWAGSRLGPRRLEGAYAWRRLLSSGARLALGSDFPVETENPLAGLYAAVARRIAGSPPGAGWSPDQRLTREEALRGFTVDAAYASYEEGSRGSIAPGLLGDLTILSADVMSAPLEEILAARVVMTIVGGRIAYDARAGSGPS